MFRLCYILGNISFVMVTSESYKFCFDVHYYILYSSALCYSYITSTSRISLLLHETEGEARG